MDCGFVCFLRLLGAINRLLRDSDIMNLNLFFAMLGGLPVLSFFFPHWRFAVILLSNFVLSIGTFRPRALRQARHRSRPIRSRRKQR